MRFLPDGKTLGLLTVDHVKKKIIFWDASNDKLLREFNPEGRPHISAVAFSRDGTVAAANLSDSRDRDKETIILWDLATGVELRRLSRTGLGRALAFSPGGEAIASSAGRSLNIRSKDRGEGLFLFDVNTGKQLFQNQYAWPILAFSPGGLLLATRAGSWVKVFETATGKEVVDWKTSDHPASLRGHLPLIVFSPDGRQLALESDMQAEVWDLATKSRTHVFTGHRGTVTAVAFTPDGKALLTGSVDGTALVWDLKRAEAAPKGADAKELWEELKNADRLRAYLAVCRLRELPAETLELLKQRLQPAAAKQPDDLETQRSLGRETAGGNEHSPGPHFPANSGRRRPGRGLDNGSRRRPQTTGETQPLRNGKPINTLIR